MSKNDLSAIEAYNSIIEIANEKDYRLCNSYLQLGLIYEQKGNLDKAKANYETCLHLSPDDYKRSLHQKARTALLRIKNGKPIKLF